MIGGMKGAEVLVLKDLKTSVLEFLAMMDKTSEETLITICSKVNLVC